MSAATAAREKPENGEPAERRTLRSDVEELIAQVTTAVVERPFTATAIAAGVGFALGGALNRTTLTMLLGTGTRFAATWLGNEIRLRAAESLDSAKEHT